MENRNTLFKMIAQTKHIEVPKEWESTNDWDSHRPLLYMAHTKMNGLTVEAGCGYGSTPMLESLNNDVHSFLSLETNEEWRLKMKLETGALIAKLNNWDEMPAKPCEVFFCDCAPGEERKKLINKMKNIAQVIVAHDTEEGSDYVYGMKEILSTFKYRLDYKPEGKPHTTAVSNSINVTEWV